MYKPGTDESNVQMSDVLCDFCHHEWLEDLPIIEGHRGAMICGKCLSVAYAEVVRASSPALTDGYTCRMCREGDEDRAALDRAGEAAWPSPLDADYLAPGEAAEAETLDTADPPTGYIIRALLVDADI